MRFERWLRIVRLRMRSIFRRDLVENDLADEVQFHLDARTTENIAKGMTPEAARTAALREFGGVEQRKEECRDARRVSIVEELVRDIAYAGRMMRREPGFTAIAILSLAISIGANTAIFSTLDALALRTLPVPSPDRLFLVEADGIVSLSQYERLRELREVFSGVSAVWTIDRSNVVVANEVEAGRSASVLRQRTTFPRLASTRRSAGHLRRTRMVHPGRIQWLSSATRTGSAVSGGHQTSRDSRSASTVSHTTSSA